MMSLLDNAQLVRDFRHCHILEIPQTTQPLFIVQANYNSKIVDTTHELEDAVGIAENHDRSAGPDKADRP
jgi:hypothetical protein